MGRTIPSFRIAAVLEYEEWKRFRKYLRNKNNASYHDVHSITSLQDVKSKWT